jgi:hypothetical protein
MIRLSRRARRRSASAERSGNAPGKSTTRVWLAGGMPRRASVTSLTGGGVRPWPPRKTVSASSGGRLEATPALPGRRSCGKIQNPAGTG